MTTPIAKYRAIAEPIVQRYKTDIEIDCELIEVGDPVIFFVRDSGTHAVQLSAFERYPPQGASVKYLFSSAGRDHILSQVKASMDNLLSQIEYTQIAYFDGSDVSLIDAPKAVKKVDDYVADMRRQFAKNNGLIAETNS